MTKFIDWEVIVPGHAWFNQGALFQFRRRIKLQQGQKVPKRNRR